MLLDSMFLKAPRKRRGCLRRTLAASTSREDFREGSRGEESFKWEVVSGGVEEGDGGRRDPVPGVENGLDVAWREVSDGGLEGVVEGPSVVGVAVGNARDLKVRVAATGCSMAATGVVAKVASTTDAAAYMASARAPAWARVDLVSSH